jgi:hypothetical protein
MAWAELFGVSAFLLWRRPSWIRAIAAIGLLVLYVALIYIVAVEWHSHGTWPISL